MKKSELIRYAAIDRCLRDIDTDYSIDDLANECLKDLDKYYPDRNFCEADISQRQIRKDLKFMRQSKLGWNLDEKNMISMPRYTNERKNKNNETIHKDKVRARAYKYKDPDFSIRKMPLIEEELPWLAEFHFLANYFKDKPDLKWITELALKLDDTRRAGMNVIVPEIRHEYTLKGFNEFFYKLYDAIFIKQVMKIEYKTYSGKEETFVMSPYFLKEYNNRWFLFGYNHDRGVITNAPIDRIEGIETSDIKYVTHTEVDGLKDLEIFDDYFDDIIGVTHDSKEKKVEVCLQFSDKRYPHVKTKPIHPNQRNYDDKRMIKLPVIPNNELYQVILSFGKDVEVVSPQSVRDRMKDIIREMSSTYGV